MTPSGRSAVAYAILFPGQGAQAVGMGADLWDDDLFARAAGVLGWNLAALCREGPAEELQKTEHAQPALFVTSYGWWAKSGLDEPAFFAGHSLGEYTAVAAAGALSFESALVLVAARGQAMAAAGEEHPGGMAALLGVSLEEAEELCRQRPSLWVANDNAPGQMVVGGSQADIEWVGGQVRRARTLAVSGAFHTPFMEPAAEKLSGAIEAVGLGAAAVPVVANVDAAPHQEPAEVADALKRQLTSRVRFTESITRMAEEAETFYCVGPGDAVAGMVRRIVPGAEVKGVPQ